MDQLLILSCLFSWRLPSCQTVHSYKKVFKICVINQACHMLSFPRKYQFELCTRLIHSLDYTTPVCEIKGLVEISFEIGEIILEMGEIILEMSEICFKMGEVSLIWVRFVMKGVRSWLKWVRSTLKWVRSML